MSIMLQKDKVTGETLVYETTNYRDKKTGKSGTRKELLGRLYPFTGEQDYEAMSDLFAEGKEPVMLEQLENADQGATKAIKDVIESVSPDAEFYSWTAVRFLMKKISDAVSVKDNNYKTLKDAYKELVIKAAEVQRDNETFQEIRDAADAEEWNAQVEHQELKIVQDQNKILEALNKNYEEQVENLNGQIETLQKMIEVYKSKDDDYKVIMDSYAEEKAQYKEREACADKLIASGDEVIAIGKERMANYDKIVFLQSKIILDLIDRLSKHEDVSDLKMVKETSEAFLVKMYSPDIIDEMDKVNAVKAYAAEGDAYEAAEEKAAEAEEAAGTEETD
ncbi:MAG: hypothetical protein LUD51_03775 [Clostridia bacterium]|nr:hypothetical protein [Clostridia bacterium]